jgi:hypothetical protein
MDVSGEQELRMAGNERTHGPTYSLQRSEGGEGMMQALYEAILEDEAVLADAFKYEVLARQAEASGDQELMEFSRQMRCENRRRAERSERMLAQRLPGKTFLRRK